MSPVQRAAFYVLVLGLSSVFFAASAPAGDCGNNEPARPVPECRNRLNGAESGCLDPDAARLWPPGFQPARPGQQLALERDSTQWRSFTIPGFNSGHELFYSLDIVGSTLYAVYNAGLQVWDIGGANAEDPERLALADGWIGDFFEFPSAGENDFFIFDIDAIDPSDGSLGVLIAVAGEDGVGTTFWEHRSSPTRLDQLYQDLGNGSRQIRIAEHEGTVYAFAAGGGINGIFVYDVSHAAGMAFPCLDNAGAVCPGVFLGKVGTTTNVAFLDLLQTGGKIYLAAGRDVGLPAEIWELADPSVPGNAVRRFSGLTGGVEGVALFEHGGDVYLAAAERQMPQLIWNVKIYGANACVTGSGSCTVTGPLFTYQPAQVGQDRFLTFTTRGDGVDFLYYGVQSNNLDGSRIEGLFDLTHLGGSNVLPEITDGGETYIDSCSGNTVDYWGDYYPNNGHGLRNVRPRIGRFRGDHFYRAAFGILDVHVVTAVTPTLIIDGPDEVCPDPAITSEFTVDAVDCSPQPPSSAYDWQVSGGGGQILANGGSSVEITWAAPGAATVSVTNVDCGAAEGELAVTVQNPASIAFEGPVTADPSLPAVGQNVQFSVDTSLGAALWRWDFGDGTIQTFSDRQLGENPVHTFNQTGPVTVRVTIADCLGTFLADERTLDLTIADESLAVDEFQAQGCNVLGFCDFCRGETVVFDQSFSGTPTLFEYDWDGDGDFDEANSKVGATISHVYAEVLSTFFPRVRISADGAAPATFDHQDPVTVTQCGPEEITVSGPDVREIDESGVYSGTASNCSPAAGGWTWEATGGGLITGDVTSAQVTVSWDSEGTKSVTATNSACGLAIGLREVMVVPPADLIFDDGFESGDLSTWPSGKP